MTGPAPSRKSASVPTDPSALQRHAAAPTASAWVAASAGSGKTKVLTDRILRLLLAGARAERILCLTFTKAAAAQMKTRLFKRLASWATLPGDRLADDLEDLLGRPPNGAERAQAQALFAHVLDCPGGIKIQTIHAFCQTLLVRFPCEAGLSPNFRLLDDAEAGERLFAAQSAVLAEAAAHPESPIGRTLTFLVTRLADKSLDETLDEILGNRAKIEHAFEVMGGRESVLAALRLGLDLTADEKVETALAHGLANDAIDLPGLRAAVQVMQTQGEDGDRKLAQALAPYLADSGRRHREWKHYLLVFFTKEDTPRARLCLKKLRDGYPHVQDTLKREQDRLAHLKDRLASLALMRETETLLHLAEQILAGYESAKRARAELDYTDLIRFASHLLGSEEAAQWVLYKLDRGIDHILIDEAQDTSAQQWQIVEALAAEFYAGQGQRAIMGTLFAVGDEKQSIYGFQGAAPRLFHRMREFYQTQAEDGGYDFRKVPMDVSFRSTQPILDLVNRVFTPGELARKLRADGLTTTHISWRAGQAGAIELWPLIEEPETDDSASIWHRADGSPPAPSANRQLAEAIAAEIEHRIESHDLLESAGRPVKAGDILILLRKREGLMGPIIRALKQRGIPCAGADRMELTQQITVLDLIALADFMLLPSDDLTLAALLKSPLLGVTEEELFLLCHGRENENVWQRLRALATDDTLVPAVREKFTANANWLGQWLGRADFIRPYEFLTQVLDQPCPADAGSGRRAFLSRLGPEILDPLADLLDLALRYEGGKAPSLQGFLAFLRRAGGTVKREAGEDGAENGPGQVRIMTIHGAKGLQAPIVFFAGAAQSTVGASRLVFSADQDGAIPALPLYAATAQAKAAAWYQAAQANKKSAAGDEYARLLYVALTRAADRLYICGTRPRRNARLIDEGWYGWIAQQFGADDPLPAPAHLTRFGISSIRRIVTSQTAPPDRIDKKKADQAPDAGLPSWISSPPPKEPSPVRPLAPSRPDGEDAPVLSPRLPEDRTRFRRGLLVHKLLQILPDLPADDRQAAAMRLLTGEPDGNRIAREALRLFDDPTTADIFGPGSKAEVPIAGLVGTRIISGQIDRLRVTGDTVWLVDYKTNRHPPARIADIPKPYISQMRAYAMALRTIYPQHTIKAALLWTAAPLVMYVPEEMLV